MSAATAAPSRTSQAPPVSDRFTVVPKARDVSAALEAARAQARAAGLPEEEWPALPDAAIRTYAALADHANNTTGLCWPEMETLAWILGKSPRTIQRHVHQLEEIGLVEIVERRRAPNGTFLGYKFRLPHIAAAASRIRERREANKAAYEERKRAQAEQREHRRKQSAARRRQARKSPKTSEPVPISGEEGARRRRAGYEWFFDRPTPPRQAEPSEDAGHGAPLPHSPPETETPPEPRDEPAPPVPDEGETTLSPSTGHECPMVPIYVTSNNNHITPQPPKGSSKDQLKNNRKSSGDETLAGESAANAGETSAAELAWVQIAAALLEARPEELDARDFAIRTASLDGPTLRVELRDTPITTWRGLHRIVVGTIADRTRDRHGGELSRLWREISADPNAVLELR